MANAIVIGASSGIGRAVALELARAGYDVGVAARRTDLLDRLAAEHGSIGPVIAIDLTDPREAAAVVARMARSMGGADVVVISSGIGEANRDLALEPELATVAVNVAGFVACANAALHHMEDAGWGTLVGLSSVAAIRPSGGAPVYAASKAFVSRYMAGLRMRARRRATGLRVLDVRPGFVDTAMMKAPNAFWVATPEKAARQIVAAIRSGRNGPLYVTRRWQIIAWLLRALPERWLPL